MMLTNNGKLVSTLALLMPTLMLGACASTVGEGATDGTESSTDSGTTGSSGAVVTVTASQSDSATGSATTDATSAGTTVGDSGEVTTSGPAGDGCCDVHGGPSCDEPDVAVCVCGEIPECCVFDWDQPCVDLAMGRCAATCEGGTGEPTTSGVSNACDELLTVEVSAADAVLTGDWELGESQVGEGTIALVTPPNTDGTVTFAADIPCDDTWRVWVRAVNFGSADSFFVRLDGEPAGDPEAFVMDCGPGGNGYLWRELNRLDPKGGACDYADNPWQQQWQQGTHEVEFSFREGRAVSRLIFTNDPDFTPGGP